MEKNYDFLDDDTWSFQEEMQNKVRADFIYLHCAAKEFKFNPQKFTIKIEIDTEKDKLGCDRRKTKNKKKNRKVFEF